MEKAKDYFICQLANCFLTYQFLQEINYNMHFLHRLLFSDSLAIYMCIININIVGQCMGSVAPLF